jgi:hypothetical protein
MTITPPCSASRTNSEVRMCSSLTDVFLMCYIVEQGVISPRSPGLVL